MSSYIIKSQPEASLLVSTSSTVGNQIGICYFDPIDETLKEIDQLTSHVLTIQPYNRGIKKYYLIVNPTGATVNSVSIQAILGSAPNSQDPTSYYSVKVIIGGTVPNQSMFDDLADENIATATNLTAGTISPIWVQVQNKAPLNALLGLIFQVNYE